MIWGGVVWEFFSIFFQVSCSILFQVSCRTLVLVLQVSSHHGAQRLTSARDGVQAILPTDRSKRRTFLEELGERGIMS